MFGSSSTDGGISLITSAIINWIASLLKELNLVGWSMHSFLSSGAASLTKIDINYLKRLHTFRNRFIFVRFFDSPSLQIASGVCEAISRRLAHITYFNLIVSIRFQHFLRLRLTTMRMNSVKLLRTWSMCLRGDLEKMIFSSRNTTANCHFIDHSLTFIVHWAVPGAFRNSNGIWTNL